MSDTSKRGRAAEYRVAAHFLELGYEVFFPASEGGSVDLEVVSPEGERQRLQVKTVYRQHRTGREFYRVRLRDASDVRRRQQARGDSSSARSLYTADSFDVLAASSADGPLWLIPVERILGKGAVDLGVTNSVGKARGDWSQYRVR